MMIKSKTIDGVIARYCEKAKKRNLPLPENVVEKQECKVEEHECKVEEPVGEEKKRFVKIQEMAYHPMPMIKMEYEPFWNGYVHYGN